MTEALAAVAEYLGKHAHSMPLGSSRVLRGPARDIARTNQMATMFEQGLTLEKIGQKFNLTRERVRQVLKGNGMTRDDGGQRMASTVKKAKTARAVEARYQLKYGLQREAVQRLQKDGTTHAYGEQVRNARSRGIPWKLDFGSWFAIWEASGKLRLRGRGKGKYLMSRIRDTGPYALGNVHIQLATENSKEAGSAQRDSKSHVGVFLLLAGTPKPWVAKFSRKYLGAFATPEEASAARDAFMAANPGLVRQMHGRGYSHTKSKNGRAEYYQVMVGKRYVGSYRSAEAALAARSEYIRLADLGQETAFKTRTRAPVKGYYRENKRGKYVAKRYNKYLGIFDTPEEARAAYLVAAAKICAASGTDPSPHLPTPEATNA